MALDKLESEKDGAGGRAKDRREAESVRFSETSIYDAISRRRSSSRLLVAIQRHSEDVQLREPGSCYTYLHLVVAISDDESEVAMVPMIFQLSNAGIDIDSRDCKNRTALELAMVKGLRALMVALLRVGSDQTTADYRSIISRLRIPGRELLMEEFERYTPDIWEAATKGDLGSVYVLVNSWCRVKVRRQGRTLLEDLRRHGGSVHTEMVSLLTSYEMTIEFVHATLAGDEATMLDILMDESDCDVDILDISYVDHQLGSLRPRSLRDTAIALNHPGRILQLLSPKCKRYEPSTGIPDLVLLYTESLDSDAEDGDAVRRRASHAMPSSHHPRSQNSTTAAAADDLHPSLTLSGIEPRISGEEESDEDNSDTNGLLFCTYRSFKDDEEEDPDRPKVVGKVRVNEEVNDVRMNRKVKDDAKIRIIDGAKERNRETKFKGTDGVKDNGKVRDNARTYCDAAKDSQRVHQYVRVDNDKGKESRASKRGREGGQPDGETSRRRQDQYEKLKGANETLDWHRGTNRTQRKNGRKGIKSTLCIVS